MNWWGSRKMKGLNKKCMSSRSREPKHTELGGGVMNVWEVPLETGGEMTSHWDQIKVQFGGDSS